MNPQLIDQEIIAAITAAISNCVQGSYRVKSIKHKCTQAWRRRARCIGTTRKLRC